MRSSAQRDELDEVRWRLDRLAEQRRLAFLTDAQRSEYDTLVRREEQLLHSLHAA